jgi:O-antigen/teichoic acid export membrane protein
LTVPDASQGFPPSPPVASSEISLAGAATNLGVLLAGRAVIGVAGVITVALLSRRLGPAEYGRLTLALAVSGLVATVAEAGLSTIGARELARADSPAQRAELRGALLGLGLTITLIATLLGWIVLQVFVSAGRTDETRAAIEVLLLLGLSAPFSLLANASATAAGRSYLVGIAQAGAALAALAVVVVLCLTHIGLITAAGAVGLASALSAPLLLWLYPAARRRPRRIFPLWKMLFGETIALAVVNLINVAYVKADALLLAGLASAAQLGVYGLVYNLVTLLIALPSLLVAAAGPVLVRASGRPARFHAVLAQMTLVTELIAVAITVPLLRFSPVIVQTLAGSRFHAGAGVLRILVIGLIATFPSGLIGAGLTALGRQRALLWPISGALVMNVALNLLLIPRWHATGAAIAFAVTELTALLATGTIYRRLVPLRPQQTRLAVIAAIGMAAPCLLGPLVFGGRSPLAALAWTVLGWCSFGGIVHRTGLDDVMRRSWRDLSVA